MEYDEITGARLSAIEARLSAIEQRQSAQERSGTAILKRHKRELTLEERQAVRKRLVAGQEKKRKEREAAAVAEAKAQSKAAKDSKKEAKNGPSEKERQ